MIWFSMLVNGRWKRRTKWCGTPLLTMGDWSDNGLFMTWNKLWMLPMRMFLINLTWYGVSKVLLLLIVICQLLGRLDPMWALFHESPVVLCWFSQCDIYISFALECVFNLCQINKSNKIVSCQSPWLPMIALHM